MKTITSTKALILLSCAVVALLVLAMWTKLPVFAFAGWSLASALEVGVLLRALRPSDAFETPAEFEARMAEHRALDDAEIERLRDEAVASVKRQAQENYRRAFQRGFEAGKVAALAEQVQSYPDPRRVPLADEPEPA